MCFSDPKGTILKNMTWRVSATHGMVYGVVAADRSPIGRGLIRRLGAVVDVIGGGGSSGAEDELHWRDKRASAAGAAEI